MGSRASWDRVSFSSLSLVLRWAVFLGWSLSLRAPSVDSGNGSRPITHMEHIPILGRRIADLLMPALEGGGVVVDCTLGRGGHAALILETSPAAHLVGIDRDAAALEESRTNLIGYGDRITLVRDEFSSLETIVERLGIAPVRGVVLDLGVSSPQLDEADRGFSFRSEGPLDMRMDTSQAFSAADVVNHYTVAELERLIGRYGEERFARRVARAIEIHRPIRTTGELAEIVKQAIPAATRRTGGHPARRTFQAIRIEVNREMEELEKVLPQAVSVTEVGALIAILTYHSLEDRMVKRFFIDRSGGCTCPPGFPVCVCDAQASLRPLSSKPVTPDDQEIAVNPRAKSAKLRVAERVAAA